jgi:hypothetical protein
MKRIPIAVALILTLSACTQPHQPTAESSVPKEKWADAMTTAMPTMLCNPKGFFRTCFQQSEDECLDQATRATKACLIKLTPEIPASLKQPDEGEIWGKKVGACTGETMEIALAAEKKKIDSVDCNDPAKWNE